MKQAAVVEPIEPAPAAARHSPAAPKGRLLIIDRYLLREYLQSFLICFISLTGLYIVIDAFTKLDEFITYAQSQGSVMTVMAKYYSYRTLSFFDGTSQILALIAAMFTVTFIQRYNEMTALEAAGIPKSRIVKPIIGAVIAIAILSAVNREFVIPSVREELSHDAQDLGGMTGKRLRPRYDHETDVLFGSSASITFANEKRIESPDFYLPAGLDRYGPSLAAGNAFYRSPQDGRPGGYLFVGVTKPRGLDTKPSLKLDGQDILMTRREYPWLNPGECFLASNVSFEHLQAADGWQNLASTTELIRGLRNRSLDFGVQERLVIHSRFVRPFLDVTLLFLGLPLLLSQSKRNVFMAIGMCMVLVITFWLVVFFCQRLGTSYLVEPALAAWLPLMIFVPCAVALSQPLKQ